MVIKVPIRITRDGCVIQSSGLPIKPQPGTVSEYAPVTNRLWFDRREDPLRIRYPIYRSANGIPIKDVSENRIMMKASSRGGVYEVRLLGDEILSIYKQVERFVITASIL